MGDFGHLGKGQTDAGDEGGEEVGDGGGAVVDGGFQFPGGGASSGADGYQLGPGGAVGLVVGEAVDGLDDDFVGHALGMGQLLGDGGVCAGDDGGSLQEETAGGAVADESGFCAGDAGDYLAGEPVQLDHVHHVVGGFGHCLEGLGTSARAAEPGTVPAALMMGRAPKRR